MYTYIHTRIYIYIYLHMHRYNWTPARSTSSHAAPASGCWLEYKLYTSESF